MNWGGRLQAHSQWDNNSESGFDSQMKVLKTATRRIKPRRTQHLILTLYWSSFLSPPGNMIFLRHPQSSWNTGQPCDCSVNLSRRATPLFPIPQLFNRRQILFKAEMIHHAAEFNHRYKMRAVAEEASCYAVLSVWSTYMQLIGPLSPFSPSFTSFLALSNHFIRFLLLLTLLIYVSTVPCELTAPYPTFALRFNWAPWISSIWPILHQGLDLPPCLFGVYFWLLWWFDNISKKYERLLYVCFQTTALSLAYKRLILIFFSSLRCFSPYMIPPE